METETDELDEFLANIFDDELNEVPNTSQPQPQEMGLQGGPGHGTSATTEAGTAQPVETAALLAPPKKNTPTSTPFPQWDVLLAGHPAHHTAANDALKIISPTRTRKITVDKLKEEIHKKLKRLNPNIPQPTFWIPADKMQHTVTANVTKLAAEDAWKVKSSELVAFTVGVGNETRYFFEASDVFVIHENESNGRRSQKRKAEDQPLVPVTTSRQFPGSLEEVASAAVRKGQEWATDANKKLCFTGFLEDLRKIKEWRAAVCLYPDCHPSHRAQHQRQLEELFVKLVNDCYLLMLDRARHLAGFSHGGSPPGGPDMPHGSNGANSNGSGSSGNSRGSGETNPQNGNGSSDTSSFGGSSQGFGGAAPRGCSHSNASWLVGAGCPAMADAGTDHTTEAPATLTSSMAPSKFLLNSISEEAVLEEMLEGINLASAGDDGKYRTISESPTSVSTVLEEKLQESVKAPNLTLDSSLIFQTKVRKNRTSYMSKERLARPLNLLQPTFGARLRSRDLSPAEAMNPPKENHMPDNHSATLYKAYTGPKELLTVLRSPDSDLRESASLPEIFLVRDLEHEGTKQAYALVPGIQPIDLSHSNRHRNWGCIFFGLIYGRKGFHEFLACDNPTYVAIKRLDKQAVQDSLARGDQENPYREVARMQELGDNVHVLGCIEFLEDEKFLYIVTLKACELGTLNHVISWGDPSDITKPARIHQIFSKILQILAYLERHGINHRDLSPDNFLFLTPDNLVVFDLAMSVRIPVNEESGQRCLIKPQGRCGTKPFMAPEIYANEEAYDGVATDLWGAAVILYCLLTNQKLYSEPHRRDPSYMYFVQARGLSSEPLNERAMGMLHRVNDLKANDGRAASVLKKWRDQAEAHQSLSDEAVSLLESLLATDPNERWTLAQAMESAFVQGFH